MASHAEPRGIISGLKSIYGIDDRELISKHSDKKIQNLSRSVALIVSDSLLERGLFKTLVNGEPLKNTVNLCQDEKFAKNISLSGCSGFLVGPTTMISAGHCFDSEADCVDKKIIFDVDVHKEVFKGYRVNTKNIFSCKKIITQKFEGETDYAVIELDRPALNRPVLTLNKTKKFTPGISVFMIGHPMGMPLTLSKETPAIEVGSDVLFGAKLDAFTGNSGSPVFNAHTFEVEGILVNGQNDFYQDSQFECSREMIYDLGNEGIFRASEIPAF